METISKYLLKNGNKTLKFQSLKAAERKQNEKAMNGEDWEIWEYSEDMKDYHLE